MLGRRIGSWILEKELGRGGMGAVYKARHFSLNTAAAVKVISAGLESAEGFRQRFRREAELQAQLQHPHVARVLDYLEQNGHWFLIIEYLERGSLADLLARGESVTRQQALVWMRQALAGLGHAHQHGIVHRDIKPANLMFNQRGEIVVVDFGIARGDTAPGLTATGTTVGTPAYISPEQIVTPNQVDGRADLYSLAVVLYELLVHRRPFASDSEFSILQAHVTQPPPPMRSIDPSIPPELEALVARALAKKPQDRYPDCESFARALELVAAPPLNVPMSAPVPGTATMHEAQFYERPPVPSEGRSPAAIRDENRRSFQRKLLAGTVCTLALAGILAVRQSDSSETRPDSAAATATTPTTATTTTATTTTATIATATIATATVATQSAGLVTPVRPNVPPPSRPPVVQQLQQQQQHHQQQQQQQPAFPGTGSMPVTTTAPPTAPPVIARPPAASLPEHPRIAVVGGGNDQIMAAALEQEMERRLSAYEVADERGDPGVDELLGSKDVTPKALGAQLLAGGFHILVLLRVEEGDRRSAGFGGQSLSMKAARLRLNAYLLPANRTIGSGWTEAVEYTELSAATKARQAFIGPTADLRQAIDAGWTQLRASSPPHAAGAAR